MKIFTISNPRTDSGGFEDENLKCSICGQLSTVYAGFKSLNGLEKYYGVKISFKKLDASKVKKEETPDDTSKKKAKAIQPFLCKSCLCNAENLINKEILKQCKR